jgi:hypothetical protein
VSGVTLGDGQRLGAEAARRIRLAARAHIQMHPPLTDAEFRRVKSQFAFDFADDHRAFLAAGLPLGKGWPDWRSGDADGLRRSLRWPVDGVLFDVEHNAFWDQGWGERPVDTRAAVKRAEEGLASAPRMVPVFSHRYLPAGRGTFGHPVLSMYQTDIICYGTDLVDYIYQEFGAGPGVERKDPRWQPRPTVAFWSDLIE